MKTLWNNPTLSGICDRLCDIIYMLSYSRLNNAELYTAWSDYTMRDFDMPHREFDIKLENISKFIKFPSDLHFNTNIIPDFHFNYYLGGGLSPESFYELYVDKKFNIEDFKKSLKETAKDFHFCCEIESFFSQIPDDFVGFHIRRGDKVRDGSDENGIQLHELDDLNKKTETSIDFLIKNGEKKFFFAGDDDEAVNYFVDYARNKGAECFYYQKEPKWQTTYFDIAGLSKSKFIITSQKYSSFSLFSSLIGGCDCKTVYSA